MVDVILYPGSSEIPKVLDISFVEVKILSLELDPSTATHIIKADNKHSDFPDTVHVT